MKKASVHRVDEIISWYDDIMTPAQKKNLLRILNHGRLAGTGKMMILPIDQIVEHGPGRSFEINPMMYDPINQVKLAVDGGVNAYAAPLGSLERAQSLIIHHQLPTILKVNSHNLMIPDNDNPKPSVHSWVEDAVRLGCEAVGFTIYPGSRSSNEMEAQVRALVADARKAGLVVVLWVYPRGEGLIKGQERAVDVISYGAALGVTLGAHIVKVKLPLDGYGISSNKDMDIYSGVDTSMLKNRIALVSRAMYDGHRLLIHSGGDFTDDDTLIQEMEAIRFGGAHGTIMGRNAFQRTYDQAVDLLHTLQDVLK